MALNGKNQNASNRAVKYITVMFAGTFLHICSTFLHILTPFHNVAIVSTRIELGRSIGFEPRLVLELRAFNAQLGVFGCFFLCHTDLVTPPIDYAN